MISNNRIVRIKVQIVQISSGRKYIKHYKLNKEGTILDAPIRLGWLYTEPHIGIWVVGKQGRVFQYEADRDDFKMVYKLPDTSEAISCGYLDRNDNIWICRKDTVLLYNIKVLI